MGLMLVEPMAGAAAEDNFNPLGRVFSAASVLVCTSNSLAGDGPALGTLATDAQLSDVLATAGGLRVWESPRIDSRHTHGTGCTLASAIAAGLAQGLGLEPAVERAREYVRRAILSAPAIGRGHGPLDHAHPLRA